MSNNEQPPPYDSPEYAEWYRRNVNPQWRPGPPAPAPTPPKNHHPFRWVFGAAGVVVAVIVAIAVATSGGSNPAGHARTAATHGHPDKVVAPTPTKDSQLDQPPSDPPASDDNSGPDTAMGTPIGQTITVTATEFDGSKDITDVTVNSVTSHSHAGDDPDPMFDPKNGRFAVINVTVKCVRGDCAYNPLYFGWQEADGTAYGETDGNGIYAGYEPELSSGDLSAGQIKRGNVGFDVPLTAGAEVTLESPDGTEVGSWK